MRLDVEVLWPSRPPQVHDAPDRFLPDAPLQTLAIPMKPSQTFAELVAKVYERAPRMLPRSFQDDLQIEHVTDHRGGLIDVEDTIADLYADATTSAGDRTIRLTTRWKEKDRARLGGHGIVRNGTAKRKRALEEDGEGLEDRATGPNDKRSPVRSFRQSGRTDVSSIHKDLSHMTTPGGPLSSNPAPTSAQRQGNPGLAHSPERRVSTGFLRAASLRDDVESVEDSDEESFRFRRRGSTRDGRSQSQSSLQDRQTTVPSSQASESRFGSRRRRNQSSSGDATWTAQEDAIAFPMGERTLSYREASVALADQGFKRSQNAIRSRWRLLKESQAKDAIRQSLGRLSQSQSSLPSASLPATPQPGRHMVAPNSKEKNLPAPDSITIGETQEDLFIHDTMDDEGVGQRGIVDAAVTSEGSMVGAAVTSPSGRSNMVPTHVGTSTEREAPSATARQLQHVPGNGGQMRLNFARDKGKGRALSTRPRTEGPERATESSEERRGMSLANCAGDSEDGLPPGTRKMVPVIPIVRRYAADVQPVVAKVLPQPVDHEIGAQRSPVTNHSASRPTHDPPEHPAPSSDGKLPRSAKQRARQAQRSVSKTPRPRKYGSKNVWKDTYDIPSDVDETTTPVRQPDLRKRHPPANQLRNETRSASRSNGNLDREARVPPHPNALSTHVPTRVSSRERDHNLQQNRRPWKFLVLTEPSMKRWQWAKQQAKRSGEERGAWQIFAEDRWADEMIQAEDPNEVLRIKRWRKRLTRCLRDQRGIPQPRRYLRFPQYWPHINVKEIARAADLESADEEIVKFDDDATTDDSERDDPMSLDWSPGEPIPSTYHRVDLAADMDFDGTDSMDSDAAYAQARSEHEERERLLDISRRRMAQVATGPEPGQKLSHPFLRRARAGEDLGDVPLSEDPDTARQQLRDLLNARREARFNEWCIDLDQTHLLDPVRSEYPTRTAIDPHDASLVFADDDYRAPEDDFEGSTQKVRSLSPMSTTPSEAEVSIPCFSVNERPVRSLSPADDRSMFVGAKSPLKVQRQSSADLSALPPPEQTKHLGQSTGIEDESTADSSEHDADSSESDGDLPVNLDGLAKDPVGLSEQDIAQDEHDLSDDADHDRPEVNEEMVMDEVMSQTGELQHDSTTSETVADGISGEHISNHVSVERDDGDAEHSSPLPAYPGEISSADEDDPEEDAGLPGLDATGTPGQPVSKPSSPAENSSYHHDNDTPPAENLLDRNVHSSQDTDDTRSGDDKAIEPKSTESATAFGKRKRAPRSARAEPPRSPSSNLEGWQSAAGGEPSAALTNDHFAVETLDAGQSNGIVGEDDQEDGAPPAVDAATTRKVHTPNTDGLDAYPLVNDERSTPPVKRRRSSGGVTRTMMKRERRKRLRKYARECREHMNPEVGPLTAASDRDAAGTDDRDIDHAVDSRTQPADVEVFQPLAVNMEQSSSQPAKDSRSSHTTELLPVDHSKAPAVEEKKHMKQRIKKDKRRLKKRKERQEDTAVTPTSRTPQLNTGGAFTNQIRALWAAGIPSPPTPTRTEVPPSSSSIAQFLREQDEDDEDSDAEHSDG